MKTAFAVLASIVLSCMLAAQTRGDTILSVTGVIDSSIPVGGSQSNGAESQFFGVSFAIGGSFNDVAITIPDMAFVDWAGTAWLTNAIGPAATPANVIATATADPFHGSLLFQSTTTTFLSGLNLSPGTYFFFLSSPFCAGNDFSIGCGMGLWPVVSSPTIQVTASGAEIVGEELVGGFLLPCSNPANCPAANFQFPPASPWIALPNSTPLAIVITGSPVPEPSSLLLFVAGLLALWVAGPRKRRLAHS